MEVDDFVVVAREIGRPLVALRQLALIVGECENERERREMAREMVNLSEQMRAQVREILRMQRVMARGVELGPVAVRGVCGEVLRGIGRERVGGMYGGVGNDAKVNEGMKIDVGMGDEAGRLEVETGGILVRYKNRERLAVGNWELLAGVVRNLCMNALECAEAGRRSELMVGERRGEIVVAVRDFGPRLSKEEVARVKRGCGVGRWDGFGGFMGEFGSGFEGLERRGMGVVELARRPGFSGVGLLMAGEFARAMRTQMEVVRHRDGMSFVVGLPVSKQGVLF